MYVWSLQQGDSSLLDTSLDFSSAAFRCNFTVTFLTVALCVLPLPSLAMFGKSVLPSVELFWLKPGEHSREGPFNTTYLYCSESQQGLPVVRPKIREIGRVLCFLETLILQLYIAECCLKLSASVGFPKTSFDIFIFYCFFTLGSLSDAEVLDCCAVRWAAVSVPVHLVYQVVLVLQVLFGCMASSRVSELPWVYKWVWVPTQELDVSVWFCMWYGRPVREKRTE